MTVQIPLLQNKAYQKESCFKPENIIREARRQKQLPAGTIPSICALDPDGDTVAFLVAQGLAHKNPYWACYHTELYEFELAGQPVGIIRWAVGASFAVLVAEELFVSGCQYLISITSAGQIKEAHQPPYFVLIEHALRDEGTSYHYLPPSPYSYLDPTLRRQLQPIIEQTELSVVAGAAWTTDAPFRETETAIVFARSQGIFAVEMEAAALYAFAAAKNKSVVCYAMVTNQMAVNEGDFEKGEHAGAKAFLNLIRITYQTLMGRLEGCLPCRRPEGGQGKGG
jgi:uridine phosphorylase